MTREDILKHSKFIVGTPRKDKTPPIKAQRRGENYTPTKEELDEEFPDFFDFDKEFDIKPAKELFKTIEDLDQEVEPEGFVMLEEIVSDIVEFEPEEEQEQSFSEFKQCAYIKEDGEQCKRQAPKNNPHCSAHRKHLEKIKQLS